MTQSKNESIKMELFQHPQFGEIHTAVKDGGKPLFKANDIAAALGYSQPAVAICKLCKRVSILETPSARGLQPTKYIEESDVYRLVMRSKLPEAERFQDWVVEEVLPCLRQNGLYMTDKAYHELFQNPDYLVELTLNYRKQVEEIRRAKEREEANRIVIEEQKKVIGELSERASYVDHVLSCPNLICISQIAQDYGMSAISFNLLLAEMRIQYRVNRQWILYAEYKDCGYVQSCTVFDQNNESRMWTYWTQRGRLFIYEMLKKRDILPLMESNSTKESGMFKFDDAKVEAIFNH